MVQKAIASVLQQKGVRYHIYIFDNHSELPLYDRIKGNKRITYVRHSKNTGFARNYYYAMKFILRRHHSFVFLLGDDDLLAYPRALADLYKLIILDKHIAVVRGGFVTYVGDVSNLTRIYLHSSVKNDSTIDSIYKAIDHNILFYSGILFRTNQFRFPHHRTYDTVSPFLTPLFMLLKRNRFAYLYRRITILAHTSHDQLALQIYNEPVSNSEGVSKALRYVDYPEWKYLHYFELFGYKIYSHSSKSVKLYYEQLIKGSSGLEKILSRVIYYSPRELLIFGKSILDACVAFQTKRLIAKKHGYILRETAL